ncbi:Methenyltetrahydromethanopterin cyclohydrolase [Planctomycetales bacterium 10988]|nr:Methenyltetrahydromethanopterin cyclohydrolase [Planctomycetales bacterium 10988]
MKLNHRAESIIDLLLENADTYRIQVHQQEAGARIVDFGINTPGGIQAGVKLAEICLADLAQVQCLPASAERVSAWQVSVQTDFPIASCLASQYAGWKVQVEDFFAMASGPMRAVYAGDPLFEDEAVKKFKESSSSVVGVLEADTLPNQAVLEEIIAKIQSSSPMITLAVAPVTSTAGAIQVVARSVETALHKLHELKFDLKSVVSAAGSAPLPPVGGKMITALGRTNDAILYGGDVVLWVDCPIETIKEVGPKVPSNASNDFGRPFQDIFERYQFDFYKIDPLLFSPAKITFIHLPTGKMLSYGEIATDVLQRSFH